MTKPGAAAWDKLKCVAPDNWRGCRGGICIAPSLLAANFAHLSEAVQGLRESGAERLHIDVMDGDFVPNFTFGVDTVRALRPETDLPLELHLMIQRPERHLPAFAAAGADAITVHLEACADLDATLQSIRELHCRAGAAINPGTPAVRLFPHLQNCDLALVMTIHPGFGGQKLIPETLPKVAAVRRELTSRNLLCDLEVDGGVDATTAADCAAAGADVLVAGTAVFGHPGGPEAGLRALRQAISTISSQ